MNLPKQLTDQAIALLEIAVIHVLAKAYERGDAWVSAVDIGREMGLYEEGGGNATWLYTKVLDKLQGEYRIEPRWNEIGNRRIGWRLTDAEWDRFNHSG